MVQSFVQRALIDRLHGAVYARSTLEGGSGVEWGEGEEESCSAQRPQLDARLLSGVMSAI